MTLPAHLSGLQASGLAENEPIAQYEIGSMRNFVYLLIDWETRSAAWVDPQRDLSHPLADLNRHGLTLKAILVTHTHADHIAGLQELSALHPTVPIHIHPKELFRIKPEAPYSSMIRPLHDGQKISLGKLEIEVLHTPGHSAGECCFFLAHPGPYLFTGDMLFIRDCGNTTSPTGNNTEMFASLQRIRKLPPETILLTGHHYQPECTTTLARELVESAPFRCSSVSELAALP